MACIRLKSIDGKVRLIPEGKAHIRVAGEVEDGIEWECEGLINAVEDQPEIDVSEISKITGLQIGDIVERAINLIPESIRPTHCLSCEKRKLALNKVGNLIAELGILGAAKKLMK